MVLVFGIIVVASEACGGAPAAPGEGASREATGAASAVGVSAAGVHVDIQPPTTTPEVPAATPVPRVPVESLQLPRFGVDSTIEQLGYVTGTQMDAPHNPYHTGWYPMWDWPGSPGNAVFAAHVNYFPGILGPFYNLDAMGPGDEVDLTLADGERLQYSVISNTLYSVDTIDMNHLITAPERPGNEEWITLVTCGGTFVPFPGQHGRGEYLDRDVVVAKRIT